MILIKLGIQFSLYITFGRKKNGTIELECSSFFLDKKILQSCFQKLWKKFSDWCLRLNQMCVPCQVLADAVSRLVVDKFSELTDNFTSPHARRKVLAGVVMTTGRTTSGHFLWTWARLLLGWIWVCFHPRPPEMRSQCRYKDKTIFSWLYA